MGDTADDVAAWSVSVDNGASWTARRSDDPGPLQWPEVTGPLEGFLDHYGRDSAVLPLGAENQFSYVTTVVNKAGSGIEVAALISTDGGVEF